jgi:hypothetical protein
LFTFAAFVALNQKQENNYSTGLFAAFRTKRFGPKWNFKTGALNYSATLP